MGKGLSFGWPVYSVFDEVKPFDGLIEAGYYYINTDIGNVSSHPKLMTYDKYVLTEYVNRLNHIMNSMKNVRTPFITKLNDKAKEILIDLKKEYNLNDKSSVTPIFK